MLHSQTRINLRENFFAAGFVWDFFATTRVHRNIRIKRMLGTRRSNECSGSLDTPGWEAHFVRLIVSSAVPLLSR